jgi:hypothetical protein
LPFVQQRALEAHIDITAIAVGLDWTNLSSRYGRYGHCASVYGLPEMFRQLYGPTPFIDTSKIQEGNDSFKFILNEKQKMHHNRQDV